MSAQLEIVLIDGGTQGQAPAGAPPEGPVASTASVGPPVRREAADTSTPPVPEAPASQPSQRQPGTDQPAELRQRHDRAPPGVSANDLLRIGDRLADATGTEAIWSIARGIAQMVSELSRGLSRFSQERPIASPPRPVESHRDAPLHDAVGPAETTPQEIPVAEIAAPESTEIPTAEPSSGPTPMEVPAPQQIESPPAAEIPAPSPLEAPASIDVPDAAEPPSTAPATPDAVQSPAAGPETKAEPTAPAASHVPQQGPVRTPVNAPPVQAGSPVSQGVSAAAGQAAKTAVPAVANQAASVAGQAARTAVPAVAGQAASTGAVAPLAGIAAAAGPAVIALGAITGAAVAYVAAIKLMSSTIRGQVEHLSGLSAELSSSMAQSDVRMELAELRRAERIGPEFAKLEQLRSKGEEALYDIGTEALELFADFVHTMEPDIKAMIDVLKVVAELVQANSGQIQILGRVVSAANMPAVWARILKTLGVLDLVLGKQLEEDDEDAFNDPFFTQLFQTFQQVQPNRVAGPQAPMGA